MKFSTPPVPPRTSPVHRARVNVLPVLSAAALAAACGLMTGCGGGSEQTSYRRGPAIQPDEPATRGGTYAQKNGDTFWVQESADEALSRQQGYGNGNTMQPSPAASPISYREPSSQPPVRGTPVRPGENPYSQAQYTEAQAAYTPTHGSESRATMPTTQASAQIDPFAQVPGFGQRAEHTPGEMTDSLDGLVHITSATDGADFDPVVSRDGTFMVFASTRHRETSDIYLKQVNGNAVRQLTADPGQDAMPAISPDGQRIAFCSDRNGTWNIYVMSTQGGQAVQLTATTAQDVHPSWSADGQRLVFSRLGERSGRWELWVMEVNQPTSAEFIGYGLFPEFCPVAGTGEQHRDKIVFQRSRERGDRGFSVWTLDYRPGDAGSPTEIAFKQGEALVNPTWSPDGQWVVYATIQNPSNVRYAATAHEPTDLWMTRADGTSRVNLTAGKYENLMPTWSPDGRIYFVSNREGPSNIWSIGTDRAIAAATGHAPTGSDAHGTMQAHDMHDTDPHHDGHDDHHHDGMAGVETDGHE